MSRLLKVFENGWFVLAVVLVWLVGSALIFNWGPIPRLSDWSGGMFFDMNADYSTDDALAAIDSFGVEGRELYRLHLRLYDPLFLTLQAVGIAALFIYATSKFSWSRGWFRMLIGIVVAMVVFDVVEDVLIGRAINSHPETSEAQVSAMRRATWLKLQCVPVFMGMVGLSIVLLLSSLFLKKSSSEPSD